MKQTLNAQLSTLNIHQEPAELDVEGWALDVERF
jgi:hypothetical protein